MKTAITGLLTAVFMSVCVAGVMAEEKKINLNAESIKKASEIIKNNPALFQDPEQLEKLMRLAQSLRQAKGN